LLLFFFHFSYMQGLPIQLCRSLNPRVVITDLDGGVCWPGARGCRPCLIGPHTLGSRCCKPACPKAAARCVSSPLAPKAGQTPHHGRCVWPANLLGLAAQVLGVRGPGGVPLASRLWPAGCNLIMPPPNSAIHSERTHSA